MRIFKLVAIGFFAFVGWGTSAYAVDTTIKTLPNSNVEAQKVQPDRIVSPSDFSRTKSGIDPRFLHKTNLSCGIPPIPPLNCSIGSCVCDQNGQNCRWTFICN